MKQLCKRGLALLMVLVMVVGLLPAITFQTEAADEYIRNWGIREEVATELSDMAVAWYEAQNTSYEELSQLSGSSDKDKVPSSALYKELQRIMTKAHTYQNSYSANNTLLAYTDCQNEGKAFSKNGISYSGNNKISSFYSGKEIGPGWDSADTWNKEHTWPNSKGLEGKDEDDVMMIRPTSVSENSSRGNAAYGESGSYYNPNKESGGKYDLRGDCARIVLYVYVRWGNTKYMWGSSGVMQSKEVLLDWMEEDPVDTWELGRNDAVQSITGTRNVFVDYPELAFDLFNENVPTGYDTPSGGTPSYTITATSNNTAYGTVSLSGKTITATPKTGYYASGYTVTSGSATVTQNGNTFTVSASSDCTVRINFAAKQQVTVSFAGGDAEEQSGYAGESMNLPTVTAPEGFTFLGWTASKLSEDTTEKPTCYTNSFIPTASTTLYALYTYTVGGTGATEYILTDISEISATDSVVVTVTTKDGTVYALTNANGTAKAPTGVTVSVSGDKLAKDPAAELIWNIGGSAGNYIFYPAGQTAAWLYCTSTNNGVRVGTNNANTFKIDAASGYLQHNGTSRYIGVYTGNPDWRCYTGYTGSSNIANQTLGFYVKGEAGTVYYTTLAACDHPEELAVEVLPTLTQQGYIQYVCADCGEELYQEDYVNAFEVKWNIALQDALSVQFAINVHQSMADTLQVKVTFDGLTQTYTGACAPSVKVAAAQMADEITIEFTDGVETVTKTYTVKQYADEILADGKMSQYHQLVKEMLNYGAAAQTYFEYNTDNLVNAGITGVGTAEVPETAGSELEVTGKAENVVFYGATLLFRNQVAVRYYFTVSDNIAEHSFTVNGTSYEPVEKDGLYYIEVGGTLPQELDDSISVLVDGTLTVSYSPMNYIVRMSQKGSGSLKALLKAMYNYHAEAKNTEAAL